MVSKISGKYVLKFLFVKIKSRITICVKSTLDYVKWTQTRIEID